MLNKDSKAPNQLAIFDPVTDADEAVPVELSTTSCVLYILYVPVQLDPADPKGATIS